MITKENLNKMNYNEQIAIIGETNRPPGGIRTIMDLVKNVYFTPDTKILEIGTSTGFTAVELAKRTNSKITSIDINEESIKIAKDRAKEHGVTDNINFLVADAMNLPFQDEEFDIVFSGNIISYIPDREKALSEYMRVLKDNGVLFATPMYYLHEPNNSLMMKVRNALKMDIKIDYESYWQKFFDNPNLELFLEEKFDFDYISDLKIGKYVEDIQKTNERFLNAQNMDDETTQEFLRLYRENIYLFRDNLSNMGYSELFLRKNKFKFDKELFLASKRIDKIGRKI
ncbi:MULTISPECIES: class I SAM-dependent methyltransferase [Lactococcus]|uniref:class I SAM-dependent methyltransferase n=1 Tax=Lactococcus TaxID=1357 RepID=UPI000A1E1D54|nr:MULTISPECIES: class I SAM-dependent methyltransferase [Lactococcus]MBK0028783.1 class I SAM-dependent methyltransferase [Lactococcus sp. S47]MCG1001129.1 class I SAM-dependent methyltransferase [Lactococcus lactis]MCL9638756.1 class I SAM-dependent methyltransferase [Lactococcus lactis]MCT0439647.1 class I SAM-dependent methyltransferase [Lactococcus lactis subsp. lactis]MCT2919119.1 class I SAM-dependent methyltransferase [Lactococcus lactis]